MRKNDENSAFVDLGPEQILDAVEAAGWECDGHLQPLASYENRVYQIGIVDQAKLVAKFYRPGRWSDAQIQEEHDFSLELLDRDLPVIVPLIDDDDQTLIRHGPYRMAFYALEAGRPPAFDHPEHRRLLGRFAARLHNICELHAFSNRPVLGVEQHGKASLEFLLASDLLPVELYDSYQSVAEHALACAATLFETCGPYPVTRIHGDLHGGNILWTDEGPLVLDFDDCGSGPAIADLWMFLSGDRDYQQTCLSDLIEGYEQFRPFPYGQLCLVEALRTLRIMRHAAWIGQRWSDPAFERAFPFFNTPRYWQDHILALREQIGAMQDTPLQALV